MKTRFGRGWCSAGILATVLLAAACSSAPSSTPRPTAAPPSNAATSAPATAAPATGTATSAPASGGAALKIALITNEAGTDFGYAYDGVHTAAEIKSQLGLDVTTSENVPLPNAADVMRQYGNQNYDLVIAWGGQFTQPMQDVSAQFPNTKFLIVNSGASNGTNLASVDIYQQDWSFIGGYLAAKLSKAGTIGYIGGQCFPSTAEDMNGAEAGAKLANPDIKFLKTFTGDFNDATKAQQAAQAMIEQGADVLGHNISGLPGIVNAAEKADPKVPIITGYVIPDTLGTDVIVAAVNKDQSRWVIEKIKQIQAGEWKADATKNHLPADWGDAILSTAALSPDALQATLQVQDDVVSGKTVVPDDTTCPQ
jgi:basic membrane lipoprotein Med (substrate-binding protein (PBP1-ABC) superfamily)